MGGTSAGEQSVNGGTDEGGHRPYGGTELCWIISETKSTVVVKLQLHDTIYWLQFY